MEYSTKRSPMFDQRQLILQFSFFKTHKKNEIKKKKIKMLASGRGVPISGYYVRLSTHSDCYDELPLEILQR